MKIPNEVSMKCNTADGRKKMMKLYGDSPNMFVGNNDEGDMVVVNICKDSMRIYTYQSNGWVRWNDYDEDGYCECEGYNGRWNVKEEAVC